MVHFISPDGKYKLGYIWDGKEFYAGYITNSGCNKQWVIEYDNNFILDENLSNDVRIYIRKL